MRIGKIGFTVSYLQANYIRSPFHKVPLTNSSLRCYIHIIVLYGLLNLAVMSQTSTVTEEDTATKLPSVRDENAIYTIDELIKRRASELRDSILLGYPREGLIDYEEHSALALDKYADAAAEALQRRGLQPVVSAFVQLSTYRQTRCPAKESLRMLQGDASLRLRRVMPAPYGGGGLSTRGFGRIFTLSS